MKYAFVLILALHWIVPLQAAQTPQARDADIAARAVFADLVDEWVRDANSNQRLCGLTIAALEEMDERSINSLRWHASPDRFDQWKAAQSRRETLVRSNPSSFVPVIREALRLPKPEDLQVPTTREGRTEDAPERVSQALGELRRRVPRSGPASRGLARSDLDRHL